MTNSVVSCKNMTTGQQAFLSEWSVTRSLSQTFATASLKMHVGEDVFLQDEISMSVEYAGTSLPLFSGIVTGQNLDDGNTLTVQCESQAGVLARSDATPADWTYNEARDMIESIAGDFGIAVAFDPALPASPAYGAEIDCGTKALAAIADACHRAGWVLMDDPADGGLLVTSVGSAAYQTVLQRGIGPLISLRLDAQDNRIASVLANRNIPAKERKGKKKIAEVDLWGAAADPYARQGTRRFVKSSTALTVSELDYLAAATSLTEGAGGIAISATVLGLIAEVDGMPWEPNRLVTVRAADRRIDEYPALIESVTMSQTAKTAQRTELSLVPPAKYYSVDLESVEGKTGTDPFRGLRLWR